VGTGGSSQAGCVRVRSGRGEDGWLRPGGGGGSGSSVVVHGRRHAGSGPHVNGRAVTAEDPCPGQGAGRGAGME
jgi:hypothetical protein